MTQPFFAKHDTMLGFVLIKNSDGTPRYIEKVACTVQEQRGGAVLADSEAGTRYFMINNWIQSIVRADAKFGDYPFDRLHHDPDDMRYWNPYSPTTAYAEILPWIAQNTHSLWCIYTRESVEDGEVETNGDPVIKRETFIGFADETDAIHYKLRWMG